MFVPFSVQIIYFQWNYLLQSELQDQTHHPDLPTDTPAREKPVSVQPELPLQTHCSAPLSCHADSS